MQLEEQFYETSAMRWKRELPWLRIFRGFRRALDARKLVLALAGVVIYALGLAILVNLPFADITPDVRESLAPWHLVGFEPQTATAQQDEVLEQIAGSRRFERSVERLSLLPRPMNDIVVPGRTLFRRGNSWSTVAWSWTRLLWALIVWAVFGGAIARIAALELAGKGAPSLRESLRHSIGFLISYLGGPLLPVIGIGCFWLLAAGLGLVGAIPGIGPLIAGALWFVPLICGAVLAVILIGIAVAWPLMYVTISAEGSDAFDALSRSYSYVFGRPWYAVFIAAVTLFYAWIVTAFLFFAADYAVDLANWAVASGMGNAAVDELAISTVGPSAPVGRKLVEFWMQGLGTLLIAYVYSLFWTEMTIAYFLLRHAEDATPFDQAYWPEPVAPGPALSGIAAAERREQALQNGNNDEPPPPVSTDSAGTAPS